MNDPFTITTMLFALVITLVWLGWSIGVRHYAASRQTIEGADLWIMFTTACVTTFALAVGWGVMVTDILKR